MKVVELADELGLTMFEILDLCDRIGIDAVNGASELPERDASRLRRLFGASEPPVVAEAMEPEAAPTFPAVTVTPTPRPSAEAPTVAQVPKRRRSDQPESEARRTDGTSGGPEPATEKPRVEAPGVDHVVAVAPVEEQRPAEKAGPSPRTDRRPLPSAGTADEAPAPKVRKETRDDKPRRTAREGNGLGVLRWLIPVAVAAIVVAVGAVLFGGGDGATTAPDGDPLGALAVGAGDCFNAAEGSTITEVGIVDCTSPHVAEVFLVTQHPARADEAYPGSDELAQAGLARCTEPFESYVGETLGSSNLVIAVTHPTESSWVERGDRTLVCSIVDADGATLDSSVVAEG